MSCTISPKNLLLNLSILTATHTRVLANIGEMSGLVKRNVELELQEHGPTRQCSRSLTAPADFSRWPIK